MDVGVLAAVHLLDEVLDSKRHVGDGFIAIRGGDIGTNVPSISTYIRTIRLDKQGISAHYLERLYGVGNPYSVVCDYTMDVGDIYYTVNIVCLSIGVTGADELYYVVNGLY